MSSDFKIDIPFDTKPLRLKELVNKALMGEVWIRYTPFEPVTDSMIVANKFGLTHHNALRAISKVHTEFGETKKFRIAENFNVSHYMTLLINRFRRTSRYVVLE